MGTGPFSLVAPPLHGAPHGLTSHQARRAGGGLTGQSSGERGPEGQAKAGTGANRRRRALRAETARVVKKPATEAPTTPSHGAAHRVNAPAATPTAHAASTRPLKRFASCQPARTTALMLAATCPATTAQAVPA